MNVKFIGAIIVLLAVFVGIGVFTGDSEEGGNTEAVSNNSFGESSLNIELVEAGDFACPACASFHPLLKELKEEYGDRVVFTFKHFPLTSIHPNALAGHRAAEAAAKQGAFWPMHDLLFEQRNLWVASATSNPVPQIESFAEQLGLNMDQFRADFASAEINSIINNDKDELDALDVDSTPTFFLNGVEIANRDLDTPDEFRAVLDGAIEAAQTEQSNPDLESGDNTQEPEAQDSDSEPES